MKPETLKFKLLRHLFAAALDTDEAEENACEGVGCDRETLDALRRELLDEDLLRSRVAAALQPYPGWAVAPSSSEDGQIAICGPEPSYRLPMDSAPLRAAIDAAEAVGAKTPPRKYAKLSWNVNDVLNYAMDRDGESPLMVFDVLTESEAEDILIEHEEDILDDTLDRGWEVLGRAVKRAVKAKQDKLN